MTEIFWLTRIGVLNDVFTFLWVVASFGIAIILFAMPISGEEWYEDLKNILKRWIKRLAVVLFVGIVGCIFTPSKEDLYLIYGLGGTIDYIKSNDKDKVLPDKVIDALTRYVDSIDEK